MTMYIKIKDNKPFEHPILAENFILAFPEIDVNNLPSDFALFERVERPNIGPYGKNLRNEYEMQEDGTVKEVWYYDDMSEQEKIDKQNEAKELWSSSNGFASWVFNEELCLYEPPVPFPQDGKRYVWRESDTSWVEIPPYPEDGNTYEFNPETAQWEQVA